MPIVMREVIEWHRLDVKAGQVPRIGGTCLFADSDGRSWLGEWRRSGDVEYGVIRSVNGMAKIPGPMMQRLQYYADMETGTITDRLCRLISYQNLSRERPAGDERLCGSVDSRGFTRVFVRALDKRIVASYKAGHTFSDFVREERIKRGTPKHKVACDLWEARYGLHRKAQ